METELDLPPLTSEQVEVISFIEMYWMRRGSFPTADQTRERFPEFNLAEALNHPTFRLALTNRGIKAPVSVIEGTITKDLTPEQVAAVAAVLNFHDHRSMAGKLKAIGVSTAQWYGWLKEPHFKKFYHEVTASSFHDAIDVAQQSLIKAMQKGDTSAIKYYMEVTGRHTADTPAIQNIKLFLARIQEAIQIHIKDPETIRAISYSFEEILQGRDPAVPARQIEGI